MADAAVTQSAGEALLTEHEKCYDSGDTAWVLLATILVLGMMPALAFFEAGLLRRKNALSLITQVFAGMGLLQMMWILFGFSLVYGPDHGGVIGDFSYSLFIHLGGKCFKGQRIPALAYALFQMMFATITPLLMTGTWAERLKFRSAMVFMMLWELLVYYPVAHWVWGGGWLGRLGVLDFAGGIVIHTTAGMSALVIALFLGKRQGFEKYHGEWPPHSIPLASIGAALLWIGWFGFNAGSALASGMTAVYAVSTTTLAASSSMFVWIVFSMLRNKYPTVNVVAVLNGAIAGLAGITPASGYILTDWATLVGIIIGVISYGGVFLFKETLHIDDALDVSSVHGLPGIVGALAIGIFATKRVNENGADGLIHGHWRLFFIQLLGVVIAAVWSMVVTTALLLILRYLPGFGLRVSARKERRGLDLEEHGHTAYVGLAAGKHDTDLDSDDDTPTHAEAVARAGLAGHRAAAADDSDAPASGAYHPINNEEEQRLMFTGGAR